MTNLKELEKKYAELGAEIERLKAEPEPEPGQVWVRSDKESLYYGEPYIVTNNDRLLCLNDGEFWCTDSLFGIGDKEGFTLAANSVEEYYRDRT